MSKFKEKICRVSRDLNFTKNSSKKMSKWGFRQLLGLEPTGKQKTEYWGNLRPPALPNNKVAQAAFFVAKARENI